MHKLGPAADCRSASSVLTTSHSSFVLFSLILQLIIFSLKVYVEIGVIVNIIQS